MRKLAVLLLFTALAGAQGKTKNVILVTADGLRWQDLFTGMDAMLKDAKEAGMKDAKERRARLWRDTPEERRKQLLPFFWGEFASRATIYGNLTRGSSVRVTNSLRVSYPGYSEILTGRAQDEVISGNVDVQNPAETVLEFVKRKLNLPREKVALFGSWDHFTWIAESRPGTITINAGYKPIDVTPRVRDLSVAQIHAKPPWDEARHDYYTVELALEYLKTVKPRMLYVTLDETDDWAHDKRYDRVLDSIGYFDHALQQIFAATDAMPEYKGNTTVIVACDHGRGSKMDDWSGHGKKVDGAEQIWLAVAGPDTPARGEAKNVPSLEQRDITPTILTLLGLDPSEMKGITGKPIH